MGSQDDRDTCEVVAVLREAVRASGLSQAGFARALATSPPRLSTYLSGKTAPSALFLVRARRLGAALGTAAVRGLMSAPVAALVMRQYVRSGEREWVWRTLLQGRDHLTLMLGGGEQELIDAWEAAPTGVGLLQWDALLAAITDHEFDLARRSAPSWAQHMTLSERWIPTHPFLSPRRVEAQTPDWLRRRNIFIPGRDLITA